MTVEELIEELLKYPKDLPIEIAVVGESTDYVEVVYDDDKKAVYMYST